MGEQNLTHAPGPFRATVRFNRWLNRLWGHLQDTVVHSKSSVTHLLPVVKSVSFASSSTSVHADNAIVMT